MSDSVQPPINDAVEATPNIEATDNLSSKKLTPQQEVIDAPQLQVINKPKQNHSRSYQVVALSVLFIFLLGSLCISCAITYKGISATFLPVNILQKAALYFLIIMLVLISFMPNIMSFFRTNLYAKMKENDVKNIADIFLHTPPTKEVEQQLKTLQKYRTNNPALNRLAYMIERNQHIYKTLIPNDQTTHLIINILAMISLVLYTLNVFVGLISFMMPQKTPIKALDVLTVATDYQIAVLVLYTLFIVGLPFMISFFMLRLNLQYNLTRITQNMLKEV